MTITRPRHPRIIIGRTATQQELSVDANATPERIARSIQEFLTSSACSALHDRDVCTFTPYAVDVWLKVLLEDRGMDARERYATVLVSIEGVDVSACSILDPAWMSNFSFSDLYNHGQFNPTGDV